jgi:hypothetical protein
METNFIHKSVHYLVDELVTNFLDVRLLLHTSSFPFCEEVQKQISCNSLQISVPTNRTYKVMGLRT